MKRITFAVVSLLVFDVSGAAPPSEDVVRTCLRGQATAPSVTIRHLDTSKISSEADYVAGFDALYLFKYRGIDAGYAKSTTDRALIYFGKIYPLSKSMPLGENHNIKSDEFDPALAQWSIVKTGVHNYFCVSFNFDGLGRSGEFQNIRGGYLLGKKSRLLYFSVRDIRQ